MFSVSQYKINQTINAGTANWIYNSAHVGMSKLRCLLSHNSTCWNSVC